MKRTNSIVWGSVGFGLCRAATLGAYMTAFGNSSLPAEVFEPTRFMAVLNASSIVTAAALLALVHAGKLRPSALWQAPAIVLLCAGFVLSALGVPRIVGGVASAVAGAIGGFSLVVLTACWLELLSAQADVRAVRTQVAYGLALQCVVVLAMLLLPPCVADLVGIACACASAGVLMVLRRNLRPTHVPAGAFPLPGSGAPPRAQRAALYRAYLCLFALMGMVGVLHTSLGGAKVGPLVAFGGAAVAMPLVVATVLALGVLALSARHPNPTAVFAGCLPVLLVALSVLPFVDEPLGAHAGLVVVACYNVVGMVFLLFVVNRSRALGVSAVALWAAQAGGSSLFLLVGYGVGGVLEAVSAARGLPRATVLAFAGLYLLMAVLLVLARRARGSGAGRRGSSHGVSDVAVPSDGSAACGTCAAVQEARTGDEQAEPPRSAMPPAAPSAPAPDPLYAALDRVAVRCELTARERDILGYLARGRSARFIADDLVLSQNTVWAHIKRVYAKTGVHSKQELMSVVERMAAGAADGAKPGADISS